MKFNTNYRLHSMQKGLAFGALADIGLYVAGWNEPSTAVMVPASLAGFGYLIGIVADGTISLTDRLKSRRLEKEVSSQ